VACAAQWSSSTAHDAPRTEETVVMKKIVPSVFFQKQLTGTAPAGTIPARLELFEHELRQAAGGTIHIDDGDGGIVTYCTADPRGLYGKHFDDDCGHL
jgi:hypothetical protein